MGSAFDPQEFLNSPQQAAFDTRFPLHRAGDWNGYIGADEKDISIRTVQVTDKETQQQIERQIMEVALYTEDPKAVGDGGTAPARCRLSVWRHQDKKGVQIKPWSRMTLAGARVKYRVAHSPRKDTGELTADVTQVAASA